MALDINMTEVSRGVFPTLVANAGPILDCARMVSKDPMAKSVDVFKFAAVTGREFTQADASHTADSANNTKTTDLGVWLFGRLHGLAFLFYVAVSLYAWGKLKWPLWAVLVALLAAMPPLVTVPVEMWFRRIGLLSDRPA